MNETLKAMEEVLKKAEQYDNLKRLHDGFLEKFTEQVNGMQKLLEEINPAVKIPVSRERRVNKKEFEEALIGTSNALRMGEQITISWVQKCYNLEYWQAQNVIKKISVGMRLENRKDGRQTYFFLRKL